MGPSDDLSDDLRLTVPPWPGRPTLRANMIVSLDGSVVGPDGRSGSLGCRTDRMLLSDLRASADVILAGRATVTVEKYGPPATPRAGRREAGQSAAPRLAIASASGHLDPGLPAVADPSRLPLVLTTTVGAARLAWLPGDCVLPFGAETLDLPAALRAISAVGLGRVVCEGGPHLLGSLLSLGMVDEICLTLSPKTVGPGPGVAVGSRTRADWDLASARAVGSFLFLHYRRRPDA